MMSWPPTDQEVFALWKKDDLERFDALAKFVSEKFPYEVKLLALSRIAEGKRKLAALRISDPPLMSDFVTLDRVRDDTIRSVWALMDDGSKLRRKRLDEEWDGMLNG